ncbi:MAG: hypothetical protein HRT95_05815 [Moritella sp.]|uniref:hypothetical protein n=1 Tax=Moritella sp. TaxID=78556 RepID=UPI001DC1AB40|nr:hypothetical protein [Moritella sp.]NQZ49708.1 hypothetical protein [Moritella sp.]
MNIQFKTKNIAQQCVDNVKSIMAAIETSYQVPYSKELSASCFSFGNQPIMFSSIEYSEFSETATLRVDVKSNFAESIIGLSLNQLNSDIKDIRAEKGHSVANDHMKLYKKVLNEHFGTNDELQFDFDNLSYTNKMFIKFNIVNITPELISAISLTLQNTTFKPKGRKTAYTL